MSFSDEEEKDEDEDEEPPTEEQIRAWASESELSRKLFQAMHPEMKL